MNPGLQLPKLEEDHNAMMPSDPAQAKEEKHDDDL